MGEWETLLVRNAKKTGSSIEEKVGKESNFLSIFNVHKAL